MKYLTLFAALAVLAGCAKGTDRNDGADVNSVEDGILSLCVDFEDELTKSSEDYVEVQEEEMKVRKVTFLVFDKVTQLLNAVKSVESIDQTCDITVPVGPKVIYAVVNGPDVTDVVRLEDMNNIMDDLKDGSLSDRGLTMIGSKECNVGAGEIPETITVRWLVSRVVLASVRCKLLPQYEKMTVECVYLGNANTEQFFSGSEGGMVNPDGCVSKDVPIGENGRKGECDSYFYRIVNGEVKVNNSLTDKYHMYCQPNGMTPHTCLYMLVDISGVKYYYRVPLNQGLVANTTYSVDVTITNLGSLTPPDGDLLKGEIQAVVTVAGWTPGYSYVAEF